MPSEVSQGLVRPHRPPPDPQKQEHQNILFVEALGGFTDPPPDPQDIAAMEAEMDEAYTPTLIVSDDEPEPFTGSPSFDDTSVFAMQW